MTNYFTIYNRFPCRRDVAGLFLLYRHFSCECQGTLLSPISTNLYGYDSPSHVHFSKSLPFHGWVASSTQTASSDSQQGAFLVTKLIICSSKELTVIFPIYQPKMWLFLCNLLPRVKLTVKNRTHLKNPLASKIHSSVLRKFNLCVGFCYLNRASTNKSQIPTNHFPQIHINKEKMHPI